MRSFLITVLLLTALASIATSQTEQEPEGCAQSPSPIEVAAYEAMIDASSARGTPEGRLAPVDYWVPVRWHIVRTSTGTGGLDASHIPAFMADLDAAFATGQTWGDFGHLKFFEALPVDFIDSTALRMIESMAELEQLKAINPTVNAVDIYVIESFPGNLGMSGVINLAGISSFTVSQAAGISPGIVVTRTSLPPASPFGSIILPHEMGHYFDLFHVYETAFGPECTGVNCGDPGTGDLVCDTPATPPLGQWNVDNACAYTTLGGWTDHCGVTQQPPTRNYMNLLNIAHCMDRFTTEQNAKAVKTLLFTRNDKSPIFTPNPPLPPTGKLPIITNHPGDDCNGNGVSDGVEIVGGTALDCNQNWIPDSCEIALGWEPDYDSDGVLDSCEVHCQTDLGYQGPGNVSLSLCGLDLAQSPSIATLHLAGGVPESFAWLALSLTANPTPFGLGTLVPALPFAVDLIPVLTDENGEFQAPVTNTTGLPITFYLQAIVPNMGVNQLSNALEVIFGI